MARSARWLMSVLTVVVVVGFGEIHAHLIGHYRFTQLPRFGWLLVFLALLLLGYYASGLPEAGERFSGALVRSFLATVVAAGLVSLLALVVGEPLLPRFVVFASVSVTTPLVAVVARSSTGAARRRNAAERVVAIVGATEAVSLSSDLEHLHNHAAVLAATMTPAELEGNRTTLRPLATLVEQHRATLLILDRASLADEKLVAQAAEVHQSGVRIRTLALFYDQWLGKLPLSELERSALFFDINEIHRSSYVRLKRATDFSVACLGLPLLALLVPVVAVLDQFGNRGPLFYRQDRVGKDGLVFQILKFRSMRPTLDAVSTWTTADDSRLGAVGRALRRSHIDELPQLVNVLRRELSIVGPRPEQPRYVAELSKEIDYYDLRHLVQPGMTGWAQVNFDYGASTLDALEKLQYEFYYLRHQSLLLDLRIVVRTLRSIVGRTGR